MEEISPQPENIKIKPILGLRDLENSTFEDIIAVLESDEQSHTRKIHAKMMRDQEVTPILLKTVAKDLRIDLTLKQAPEILEKIKKNSQ